MNSGVGAVPHRQSRMESRLWRHHLPLFVFSFATVAALFSTRPYRDVVSRASVAAAYPALALMAATLLVGPWNLLR